VKRCLKGSPEPNCLTTFRNTPPLGDWDEFRDTQCYQTVRATTRADQGGLCAYCERLLGENDRQIAHFHPKSDATGTVNWALHWPNLWCACTGGDQAALANHPDAYLPPPVENRSCDVAKEDRVVDGSVLSPAEVPAYPRLFKYKQWVDGLHIGADNTNCAVANISPDLAKATIDTFNLNCRRLAQATLAVHRAIEGQIKRLREHAPQPEALFPSLVQWHLARSQDGCWKPFFTQMRWRFKEAAETYLQSIDYQG
jgi:uncharacterized protein (TIGR02646 family)